MSMDDSGDPTGADDSGPTGPPGGAHSAESGGRSVADILGELKAKHAPEPPTQFTAAVPPVSAAPTASTDRAVDDDPTQIVAAAPIPAAEAIEGAPGADSVFGPRSNAGIAAPAAAEASAAAGGGAVAGASAPAAVGTLDRLLGDGADAPDEAPAAASKNQREPEPVWRKIVSGFGQTCITLGVVVLLFIVYEAFITDIFNAQKQDQLNEQLQQDWADAPTVGDPSQSTNYSDVPVGDALGIMRVPAFGADYAQVVVQGTTNAALELGPGHYNDTAGPGEIGNFSIAGHRVGKGSPFLNLDQLKPGDAIVFETQTEWYVYRVIGNKDTGDFTDPNYPGIKGQYITTPSHYEVISPVPDDPTGVPTQAIMTLTTCHPKFSAAERLIIHAGLEGQPLPKAQYPTAADVPALQEG